MSIGLQWVDLIALSPLLILLGGALVALVMESFAIPIAFPVTLFTLLLALGAILALPTSPVSTHPLLTPWLSFDGLSQLFTLFFLVVGLAVCLLSSSFFQTVGGTQGEYYFFLLSALAGLILIASSADFLTLFLGLETLSVALYILCGYVKRWKISHESAIKYFLMGAIAAAFLLYGIALIYGAVGSTRFDRLLTAYRGFTQGSDRTLFLGGIAFVTLGLAFKAAIVPFHVWAPDVYDGAPTPVTAFMAVGTKVGAFAAFIKVFLVALPHFDPLWNQLIAVLAIPTLIYANAVALRQVQLRRFFAYSGISHAGFLLLPLAAQTPDALSALMFYLVVYALATLGCFSVLAYLDQRSDGVMIRDLYGLYQRSPFLAGTLTLCLLTLAGIPPTVGFFAKFFVLKAAFQAGYTVLVVVGLLTTILSAFYYLRIVAVMFSESAVEMTSPRFFWPTAFVCSVACVALILLSLYPSAILT